MIVIQRYQDNDAANYNENDLTFIVTGKFKMIVTFMLCLHLKVGNIPKEIIGCSLT